MTAHINVMSDDHDSYVAKAFYFSHPGKNMRPKDFRKYGHTHTEIADTPEHALQKLNEALAMEYGSLVIVEIE